MDRNALKRLGHHVVSRRVALGFRNRTDLADSLQFTVRTLADIEVCARPAPAPTPCWKTSWPGRREASTPILAGGEPQALGPTLRRTNPNEVPTEELLSELRRRIIALRDTRHESWDDWGGGLDPHGD